MSERSALRIQLLPSAVGRSAPQTFATTYLVNGRVAVDAGCLGFSGEPEDQARIRHVLLTHSHADHIASLPIFVENAYLGGGGGVQVHGHPAVLDSLRRDVFNGRVWPDLLALPPPGRPFLELLPIEAERPFELEALRVTAVEVDHTVPTFGYVIETADAAAVIVSDTGPTRRIWEVANRTPNLRAVFLEASFPRSQREFADLSKHLSTCRFAEEIGKLQRPVRTIAVHLKPRFDAEIRRELEELGLEDLEVGEAGREYCW